MAPLLSVEVWSDISRSLKQALFQIGIYVNLPFFSLQAWADYGLAYVILVPTGTTLDWVNYLWLQSLKLVTAGFFLKAFAFLHFYWFASVLDNFA